MTQAAFDSLTGNAAQLGHHVYGLVRLGENPRLCGAVAQTAATLAFLACPWLREVSR